MKLNYSQVMNFTDPKNIQHYNFIVKATELPHGLSFAVNPRTPDTTKKVAKEIRETLDSGNGDFLQKNLGVTILAKEVTLNDKAKIAEINFGSQANVNTKGRQHPYGIANGGHTYAVINEAVKTNGDFLKNQFVSVRVIANIKEGTALELAKTLNTSLNVDDESIANLKAQFQWIKKAIDGDIEKKIQWHQGHDGVLKVSDLFCILLCMHPEKFRVSSNPDIDDHPNQIYASKAAARKEYEAKATDENSIQKLSPLINDILELRDYIHLRAWDILPPRFKKNNPTITLLERTKEGRKFISPKYANTEPEKTLNKATVYPIFASYRCLIKLGKEYKWNVQGGIDGVKKYVDSLLPKQFETIEEIIRKNHREASPTQWGKDEYIWSSCYRIVNNYYRNKK